MADEDAAAERKRKRLEAWRIKRQQQKDEERKSRSFQPAVALPGPESGDNKQNDGGAGAAGEKDKPKAKVKIGLGLGGIKGRKKKKGKGKRTPALLDDDDGGGDGAAETHSDGRRPGLLGFDDLKSAGNKRPRSNGENSREKGAEDGGGPKKRRRGRWDVKAEDGGGDSSADVPAQSTTTAQAASPSTNEREDREVNDALDAYMLRLETVAEPDAADATEGTASNSGGSQEARGGGSGIKFDSRGSMVRMARTSVKLRVANVTRNEGAPGSSADAPANDAAAASADYSYSDWESDAPATPLHAGHDDDDADETDGEENEEEERARRAFIAALRRAKAPTHEEAEELADYETRTEVMSEKERREDHVRRLEDEADRLRKEAGVGVELGRIYNDEDGGVMEESERTLAALTAAPDALEVLAEMNKKRELRSVDHGSVEYLPVRKNLYTVPRSLAGLSPEEVAARRARIGVKVRGRGAPAPVSGFGEAGLSEKLVGLLDKRGITEPFPVQAQCIPAIMAGRDVIGIAKTGSGKTLAFVLPMLRHILDQPPLAVGETGPIGLVLAPARELAYQIHVVCKGLCKHVGLRSTAVYGGAGVAEQIGDLKRGTHVLCATPGRLIDLLTMQSGKMISMQRVSMVCLDEADRAFDMGFEPQLSAILAAVRPDRQTVLFSATFPKAVENLAKKSLRAPLEIIVGGRSVASDSVDQFAEIVEEDEKFLRLLQILGDHVVDGKKVIVFVAKQDQADSLFEQLTRCGYSSLSIHGGLDQDDRDSNMSDFKSADGPSVLVATSVAGRGLDVSSVGCVVNYCSPNHIEDYVHRVGRTGRAGKRGVAFTFVNSSDEAKFAPHVVRAMVESGQSKNVSKELQELSDSFKEKVAKGEAKWAGSGYKGKGYTYDSSELSDAQKLANMEKRQAQIEAGLLDPDDDEPRGEVDTDMNAEDNGTVSDTAGASNKGAKGMLSNVSSEVLAIPGMREALMRKAGFLPEDDGVGTMISENHWVYEVEINDYPQQARWKVTQKETTSRLQDEFLTAVTLKGQYIPASKPLAAGDRRLYLHLEAQSQQVLSKCVLEIQRILNEETLKVGAKVSGGGGGRYSVL